MRGRAGRGPPKRYRGLCLHHPKSAYIIGAAGAAAFFAARRLAGFFALRAGFRVAFFATLRFAAFFFAGLRPAFSRSYAPASSLRPYGPWSASSQLSYVQAFSLQSSALKRLPRRVRSAQHATYQKHREICGGCINEAIPTPKPKNPCQSKKRETQYFVMF